MLVQRNFDFVVFDLYIELLDFGHRVDGRDAGRKAVDPSVPRTLNRQIALIVEALAQRPSAMHARVVQSVELAVHVE